MAPAVAVEAKGSDAKGLEVELASGAAAGAAGHSAMEKAAAFGATVEEVKGAATMD